MTRSTLLYFIFSATAFSCAAQCDTCNIQEVLLVGTIHRTSQERVTEVIPVAEAIRRFNPGVICVEYPIPEDTASVIWRGGAQAFENTEKNRKEWTMSTEFPGAITSLQNHLREKPFDHKKRLELQQHYYLAHDLGNADYQGYLVFKKIDRDSKAEAILKDAFASYETLRARYERGQWLNNEYHILVFPLAQELNISYLHPIDDVSNWKQIQKYHDRLQSPDTGDSIKVSYHEQMYAFKKRMDSLPLETNQYIRINSSPFARDMLIVQGYVIGSDSLNGDLKMRHRLWVLRNRKMAEYIDQVARDHPGKDVVVFFGAAHIGAVREELKKLHTKYQILTLPDILK